MNWRKPLYFALNRSRGYDVALYWGEIARDDAQGFDPRQLDLRLQSVLRHAFRSVPYYSGLGSIAEGGANPFDVLRRLPLVSKDMIRTLGPQLHSSDLSSRKWYRNTSGGSTGEPVQLVQDAEYGAKGLAVTATFSRWAGKDIGEREIRLWGSERDILEGSLGWKNQAKNWITHVRFLNAFRMSPDDMRRYINIINEYRPKIVVAYAQSAYELARLAIDSRLKIQAPAGVITSAGMLLPNMRKAIESAFGAKVFNRYGSREVGDIACQCSAGKGMHVAPWSTYIEIVDYNGNPAPVGTEGEIVITSLTNYAMPLIRYRIGDRGTLAPEGSCGCGRRGQILDRLLGRTVDVFHREDGTIVDGEYFTHLMYFRDCVTKFQVVQKDYHTVCYRLVMDGRSLNAVEIEQITNGTKAVMGSTCNVQFEEVPEIEPLASGKFRFTISNVERQVN